MKIMRKYVLPAAAGAALFLATDAVPGTAEPSKEPYETNYVIRDSSVEALTKQLDDYVQSHGGSFYFNIDGKLHKFREVIIGNKYLIQSFDDSDINVSYIAIAKLGSDCFYFGNAGKDGNVDVFTVKRGIDGIYTTSALENASKFIMSGGSSGLDDGLEAPKDDNERKRINDEYAMRAAEILKLAGSF